MKLTEGKLVRWLEGEDWKTGSIVLDLMFGAIEYDCGVISLAVASPSDRILVKHSLTNELEFVEYGKLQDREVRKD